MTDTPTDSASPVAEPTLAAPTPIPSQEEVLASDNEGVGEDGQAEVIKEQAHEEQESEPSPVPSPQPKPSAVPAAPIEVTYFTPSQGEGPYYPVNKLDDRDNDLTVLGGATGTPAGQFIEFGGVVYDARGVPQPGVVVEIWQTDANGVYLHPDDPGTDQRDTNFQFYGESITTSDGRYHFRTILPGRYEPRPRHIHVKVKQDGQELLTTQFYFADDPELAGESMFNQAGGDGEHLLITLKEGQDSEDNPVLVGRRDIILDVDLSN